MKTIEENEVIHLAKMDVEEAIEILIKKYQNMTFLILKEYNLYLKSMEFDDFIQVGCIGILKAIRYFDNTKDFKFINFVKLCMKAELISFVKKNSSKKQNLLTEATHQKVFSGEEFIQGLSIDEIIGTDIYNPERLLIYKELVMSLKKFTKQEFSELEYNVFELMIEGYSYTEIAKFLGKNKKMIDNTMQRVKRKVRENF
ncbi:sigma-70 family RNA polymerase sigma factor [Cetobacterium sp.]|uniref:sigma-70 family RNA polymerase sigma factor n=1 Tax=Cetobacterium sp. TaxID=2071632 RepID=UPI003F378708